jgi:hypothetical protein
MMPLPARRRLIKVKQSPLPGAARHMNLADAGSATGSVRLDALREGDENDAPREVE